MTIEDVHPFCKDFLENPCRVMVAGELGSPLRKHLKAKQLSSAVPLLGINRSIYS